MWLLTEFLLGCCTEGLSSSLDLVQRQLFFLPRGSLQPGGLLPQRMRTEKLIESNKSETSVCNLIMKATFYHFRCINYKQVTRSGPHFRGMGLYADMNTSGDLQDATFENWLLQMILIPKLNNASHQPQELENDREVVFLRLKVKSKISQVKENS